MATDKCLSEQSRKAQSRKQLEVLFKQKFQQNPSLFHHSYVKDVQYGLLRTISDTELFHALWKSGHNFSHEGLCSWSAQEILGEDGFLIIWGVCCTKANFIVFEGTAKNFRHDDAAYMAGNVWFDGCSNFHVCAQSDSSKYIHYCEEEQIAKHLMLIAHLRNEGPRRMRNEEGDHLEIELTVKVGDNQLCLNPVEITDFSQAFAQSVYESGIKVIQDK